MKKTSLAYLLFVIIYFPCLAQDNKLDIPFETLLKELHAEFRMPAGFEQTSVNKNLNVFYQFAIKDTASGFEVRYFLKPYSRIMKDFDKKKFNPEEHTYNFFISTITNANSTKDIPKVDVFKYEDIKKDFNADWGATSAFKPNSILGGNFEFCASQIIKKNGIGEIYIFWMFTEVAPQEQLLSNTYTSLKFKE